MNLSLVFVYKIPQIRKLITNKSSVGISVASMKMEVLSVLFCIAYYYTFNYSLWNYGELYVNFAQQLLILSLLFRYNGMSKKDFIATMIGFLVFFAIIMSKVLPVILIEGFIGVSTAIYVLAKMNGARELLRTKYSRNYSLITLIISSGGVTSRLITTMATLWHDKLLIVI